MKAKDAHAIKFRITPNIEPYKEYVYMSEDAFEKLPRQGGCWGLHDIDSIIPEYFTQEKIDEYKKKLCEQIMNSKNPFSIYEVDLDCYPVDEDEIWR